MNLRNVDLNLLVVFETIFEEQSITRASERLHMSQPSMSNALSRLRNTLKDPLFVRTSKGMIPTERARQLIEPVHDALVIIRNALQEQWAFDYATAEHIFTIAMSDYSESVILPRLMDWIAGIAPGINIRVIPLNEDNLPYELQSGKVDLAIGYINSLEKGFDCDELLIEDFVTIVRGSHPKIKNSLTLKQFSSIPHVTITPRAGELTIDQILSEKGYRRSIALQVPNFLSIPPIISSTNYLSTIPLRVAQTYAKHMNLALLKPPVSLQKRSINQYWHTHKNKDTAHTWLRRSLHEICSHL